MMLSLRFGLSGLLVLPWLVLHRKDLCLTRQDLVPLGVMVLVGFGQSQVPAIWWIGVDHRFGCGLAREQ
jgi:hypothetical protein